jgi:carbon storage regulator
MLVLSRKAGERIDIGDDVSVFVVETSNGRVRIGIEAPREISVRRGELLRRKKENEDAGSASGCLELAVTNE